MNPNYFRRLLTFVCLALLPDLFGANLAHAGNLDELVVLLPGKWDHQAKLSVAIWLHGYGADPSTLNKDAHYQETADALGIAIVGIPATHQLGAHSYEWREEPDADLTQVNKGLREAQKRSGAVFGKKVLFGFSQGAVVAAELSAAHPELFVGAIILSPGANIFPLPRSAVAGNQSQKYYISTGAEEDPGNLQFARTYQKFLTDIGSGVTYREVPGMKKHGRPPDWPEKFRTWTDTLLSVTL